ncbi:colicin D domain-containing protein [Streptacidiphilus rugosus]|uniref:colicin D domain-containing protein n=1 Tax=Streptacidiphilus rugosus TaxID=405783 RepID=UPI0009FDE797
MKDFLDGDGIVKDSISYRGNPVTAHYHAEKRLAVLANPGGSFLSGWKLSESQISSVINDRFLF